MRYMLDTNICIYAIKQNPDKVLLELKKHDPSSICISSLTYGELMYGVEKSKAKEKNLIALLYLLSNIEIIGFDNKAAEEYGRIRADLEKRGTPIGTIDTMITAHCKSLNYTVVTNNEKEFKRVKGLRVENWTK